MSSKDEILLSLKKALSNLKIQAEPAIENTASLSFGDYTSNIALKLKIKPEEIIKNFEKPKSLEKVETQGGFINFWLARDYLINRLDSVTRKEKILKGKKIMIEFTDPNPFKEFHVGHLYSNIVGESISRLLEQLGANVARVNYQGDVGLHVAKAVWGMKKKTSELKSLEKRTLAEKVKFLGECYVAGDRVYENDQKAKKDIEELNKKIYRGDKEIKALYDKGRKWSLEYFEEIYKRLGTKFDFYYFESKAGKTGLDLVRRHMKVFEESQGAVIFPGEKYGLHNRVFISSQGLPTYEAKELGLAPTKYKDFAYDQSIIVTGNEIVEYFKVVKTALSKIDPEIADKTKHISHGMVRFPGGKISSRAGNVLSYGWLIKAVKDKILEEFKDMDEKVGEQVSLGAIKYALLKSRIGSDIEFDIQKSISLEGDSGPYLQYAYVRTQSVIGKSKIKKGHSFGIQKSKIKITNYQLLNNEELMLLRILHKFPETVQDAAINYSPNTLCSYLFDLASQFSLFYQKHRIAENEFRLKLTSKVGETLKNGLFLLGIESPKKM